MSPKERDSFGEEQEKVAGEVLKSLCRCNRVGSITSCWIHESHQAEYLTKRRSLSVCRCWLVSHGASCGQSMGKDRRGLSTALWLRGDGVKA